MPPSLSIIFFTLSLVISRFLPHASSNVSSTNATASLLLFLSQMLIIEILGPAASGLAQHLYETPLKPDLWLSSAVHSLVTQSYTQLRTEMEHTCQLCPHQRHKVDHPILVTSQVHERSISKNMRRFYITIAIPHMLYAADLFLTLQSRQASGSKGHI